MQDQSFIFRHIFASCPDYSEKILYTSSFIFTKKCNKNDVGFHNFYSILFSGPCTLKALNFCILFNQKILTKTIFVNKMLCGHIFS